MKRHRNDSLLNFNTFHIPSIAEELIIIENENEYERVLEIISKSTVRTLILGSGSNILFTSDFRGKVIKINISEKRFRIRMMNLRGYVRQQELTGIRLLSEP